MPSPAEPGPRSAPPAWAVRWAEWSDRHRRAIVGVSVLVAVAGALLASRLPVYGDFSWLLPPDVRSVRDLRALSERVSSLGTLLVVVESDDPAQRTRVAEALTERLRRVDPELVASVTADDARARAFRWEHRFLFAPLEDLQAARDALSRRVAQGALEANPLYVSFEDEEERQEARAGGEADPEAARKLEQLRERMREGERKAQESAGLVSKDGRLQLMVVRTPFASSEVRRARRLMDAARTAVRDVCVAPACSAPQIDAAPGPTAVTVGLAGDVVNAQAEQRSILGGMLLSVTLTVVIVGVGLLAYYRSVRALAALMWALTVGALATFGFTKLAVGHLNLATAFLSSIVVGNGINFGIVVLARYFEELRVGRTGTDAIAATVAGTLRGSITAGAAAMTAYASLIITQFRGFRHFGIIGGAGMLLCWAATFTVLPALLATLSRRGLKARGEPLAPQLLARLYPRRSGVALLVALGALVVTAAGSVVYLTHDPMERDFRRVRSSSAEILTIRRWIEKIDRGFGRGISGGLVVALPTPEAATRVAGRMRALDAGKPEAERLFSRVTTLADQLPQDQEQKLALLAEVRRLLAGGAAAATLSEEDRRLLVPPEGLRALQPEDVPIELAWPYTERDGTRGRLVLAGVSMHFNTWLSDDLQAFVRRFRAVDVEDAQVGGSAFVFADLLTSMEVDAPRATVAAVVGAVLVVVLMLGASRHAAVTLAAGLLGTTSMMALSGLVGIKVNFLDFAALPITIGLGIDYAANLSARHLATGEGPRQLLSTIGGAVFLCSFTTVVGYGSLLLSENQGLRSFGAASILGELTCLGAALLAVPALLTRYTPDRT